GRPALHFIDPDGLRLIFVVANGEKESFWQGWDKADIPMEHQILGMGPVELTVRRLNKLRKMLTDLLGYVEKGLVHEGLIFQAVDGEVFGEIIAIEKADKREKPGKGSVHHLAIRVKDESELRELDEKIKAFGFETTGVVDRYYFSSLYFRESNGIMFEIATDGPGFTVDQDETLLGKDRKSVV